MTRRFMVSSTCLVLFASAFLVAPAQAQAIGTTLTIPSAPVRTTNWGDLPATSDTSEIEQPAKPLGQRQTKADAAPTISPLERIDTRIDNRVNSRIENRLGRLPGQKVETNDANGKAQARTRQGGRIPR